MKAFTVLFLIGAALSLIIGVVCRILGTSFPLHQTPPQSFLEFSILCLLFSIALSLYTISKK